MARFSLYKNQGGNGYLLDVQADAMSYLDSRVVIPVLPLTASSPPAGILNPVVTIDGEPYMLLTQALAAVPERILKHPLLGLPEQRDQITAALDLLFQGF